MKVYAVIDNPFKHAIANQDDLKGLAENLIHDLVPDTNKNYPFPVYHELGAAQAAAQDKADRNDTNYSVVEVEVNKKHLKNGRFEDGEQVNAHHFAFQAVHGNFAKAAPVVASSQPDLDVLEELDLSDILGEESPKATEEKATAKPVAPVTTEVKASETAKPAAPVATEVKASETAKPAAPIATEVKASETAKPAAPVATEVKASETAKPAAPIATEVKASETAKPAAPVASKPAAPVATKPAAPKSAPSSEKKAPELNVDETNEDSKKSSRLRSVLKFGALCLAGGAVLTYGGAIAGATLATKLIAGSVITAGAMATSWLAYKGLSAAANAYSNWKASRTPANPENKDDAKDGNKAKPANDKVVEDALAPKAPVVGAARDAHAKQAKPQPQQAPANDPTAEDQKRKGCVIV